MVPDSPGQKLIPHKHGFIDDLACLIIIKVLLKTTHNMVRVAEKEVLRKIHRAEELLVSTHHKRKMDGKKSKAR